MPNPIKGFQTKDGVRKYDYNELENLPENDPDDLALEVEEVKENIEAKKANIDGYYQDMTVGDAEQLLATVGNEDSVPYNFRASGGTIDIGDREEDMVVGGTICWNQLVCNGNFVDNSGWGSNISCANNIATFTGGQQGTYNTTITRTNNLLVPNHKLLIIADVRCSSPVKCRVRYPFVGSKGTSLSANIWARHYGIGTSLESANQIGIQFDGITDATYNVKNFVCFDLTQMFGSTIADYIYNLEQANEGDGVAWFKKLFPKDYYEYNAGELISVKTSAHKMVGFNLFNLDESRISFFDDFESSGTRYRNTKSDTKNNFDFRVQYFRNTVSVAQPGTTVKTVGGRTCHIFNVPRSIDFNYVRFKHNGSKIDLRLMDLPGDLFIKGATYCISFTAEKTDPTTVGGIVLNDICINLSWDGERDGEYEEYVEHVYPLDSSLELRGIPKLDSANNLYYDGDTYESDGTVTRKYGVVVLDGSADENWSKETNTSAGAFAMQISGIENRFVYSDAAEIKWRSNYLPPIAPNATWGDFNSFISVKGITEDSSSFVCGISTITTVANWRTHLSSNPLVVVYELEEPTTETAEPYVNPQIVNDFGTEEYVDERAVPIPVGHETTYMANLRAKLEMAPDSPSADGEYIVKQTNGQNEYIALGSSTTMQSIMAKLPNPPSEDGTYTLKVTVANGTATYSWGANS